MLEYSSIVSVFRATLSSLLILSVAILSHGCIAALGFVGYSASVAVHPELDVDRHLGTSDAQFTPDGKALLITYRDLVSFSQHIYQVDIDDGTATQMTHGERFDSNPIYSPDGSLILFSSARSAKYKEKGSVDLYVIHADGSALKRLTDSPGHYMYHTWSRRGDQIAYVSDFQIHIVHKEGGFPIQITWSRSENRFPAFIQDDSELVFWRGHSTYKGRWRDFSPYVLRLDNLEVWRLQEREEFNLRHATLSPKGTFLLWQPSDYDPSETYLMSPRTNADIVPIEPSGSEYRFVWRMKGSKVDGTIGNRRLQHPVLSRDERKLLFTLYADLDFDGGLDGFGPQELHVLDLATNEARQITFLNQYVYEGQFSPDGEWIVFRVREIPTKNKQTYEMYVVRTDGSQLKKITPVFESEK